MKRFRWSWSFLCWVALITASVSLDFPGGSNGKASAYNAGDPGLIPGSGRSPGEGNGNPLQYSCLENPMDGEATVHRVAKNQKRLSDFTFTFITCNKPIEIFVFLRVLFCLFPNL